MRKRTYRNSDTKSAVIPCRVHKSHSHRLCDCVRVELSARVRTPCDHAKGLLGVANGLAAGGLGDPKGFACAAGAGAPKGLGSAFFGAGAC